MGNSIRKVIGAIFSVIGLGLIVVSFFFALFVLIYGVPIFIIGLIIFFNKKEDEIEQRKDLNKSGTKK